LAQAILYRGAGFEIVWLQLAAIAGLGLVFSSSPCCGSGRVSLPKAEALASLVT
jgi:hypothetical protein